MFNRILNLIKNINYLSKNRLWNLRESDISFLTEKIIDDSLAERNYRNVNLKYPKILNCVDSLNILKKSPKSLARFGDGEIKLILGNDQPFQRYDKRLAERMLSMIKNQNDDIYIAINSGYFTLRSSLSDEFSPYYLRNGFEFRRFLLSVMDYDNVYLTTQWTDLWRSHTDENDLFANEVCELFKDKSVFLVAGEGVTEKLQFNVFYMASSLTKFYGPSKNAFNCYDDLLSEIKRKASKEQLICIILGMTSKVLVEDLTEAGYLAFDVGHLAKYYDYYKRDVKRTSDEVSKFFAPD